MDIHAWMLIGSSYILGSVPSAYLVSRWFKGRDIRQYGSGTVSGSMVWEHVAHWAVVPVGVFDIGKAALPVWLALRMDMGLTVATAAGMAAAVGHNWPIFLGFTGGRGLGCFVGTLLVVFPWGVPWMVVFLLVGWRLGDSAPWALASLLTLPLLSRFTGKTASFVVPVVGVMLLLTVIKRLEANRRPLPVAGPERRRVLLRRLIFDRDMASHSDWIRRQPDNTGAA